MQAGKRNRKILIERRTPGQDSAGQPFNDWTTVASPMARRVWKKGGESEGQTGRTAEQEAVWEITFREGITPSMRVTYRGTTWFIADVAEIGYREGLLLTCFAREVTGGA